MAQFEADRAAAFASQANRSRELAAGYIQQAISIAREVRDLRNAVTQSLSAASIAHRWIGTRLEILAPDGTWSTGPDLKGASGPGITAAVIDENYHLILTIEGVGEIDAGYLRGAPGADGVDGIDGQDGAPGTSGTDGANGVDGADGISITGATINGDGHLVLSFSVGPAADLGKVVAEDGADGSNGEDGADGAAATITIGSVTTLPAGSPATVQNVGTANAAVLDIAIPEGADGADGADGDDGLVNSVGAGFGIEVDSSNPLQPVVGLNDASVASLALAGTAVQQDQDANLTAGYTATAGNDGVIMGGTYTPSPVGGNFKKVVNGGAHTLASPTAAGDYTMVISYGNDENAGPITPFGFDLLTGDEPVTDFGAQYFIYITKLDGAVHGNIVLLAGGLS